MIEQAPVFVAGGTGYLGRALLATLVERAHSVTALVRPGAESRLPSGVRAVVGDALDAASYRSMVPARSTFVHLVGTPNPNPSKAAEFERVDLGSLTAALTAAERAAVAHFVYVSVAQPAPTMRAYVGVRARGETAIIAAHERWGLSATILRPWYVLGPGHRWPLALVPLYTMARRIPSLRAGAERLGLVTRTQMVRALVHAVERTAQGIEIIDVPRIRAIGSAPAGTSTHVSS